MEKSIPSTTNHSAPCVTLKGRVAIITGGAQGIGYAVAQRLLARGAKISLWDRDGAALAQARHSLQAQGSTTEVHTLEINITQAEQVEIAATEVMKTFGCIDILVNSAGVAGINEPLADYPIQQWQDVININLNGAFYVNKAVVKHMIARNYGRIVNIASIAGKEGNPNASAYSASKAGVIAMTKSLGKEVALCNIAVNVVTPAAAKTRIFEQMSPTHINYMLAKIPRGRFVELEEIAAMVEWLAGEENSFTTGAVFDLSGGRATY